MIFNTATLALSMAAAGTVYMVLGGRPGVIELQANPDWQRIPVFVMTALDLSEQDRRRLNVGIEKILSKGHYGPRDLAARIRSMLGESQRRESAAKAV